jgi:photosystem II stability/assembly factor-like uncharacterized protein
MKKFCLIITGLLLLAACASHPASPTTMPAILPTQASSPVVTRPLAAQSTPTPTHELPASTQTSSPPTSDIAAPIPHLTANTSFNPIGIQMLDPHQGWSVASDLQQDTHILRTQDGAQTWQDVTPPEPASTAQQNGKRLLPYFLDTQNAWAVYWTSDVEAGPVFNEKVWYTTDGGQKWQSSAELDTSAWEGGYSQPAYLEFTDTQNGFLALAHDPGAGQAPISIYRTQDGGANWTVAKEPLDQGDSYIDACCQTGMAFIDPLNGVVTKDPGPVSRTYFVWSRDGGVTWSNLEPPSADQQLFESGMCGTFSPHVGQPGILRMIVSCTQDAVPDSPPTAFLYTTSDFGESWTYDVLPDLPWDRTTWTSLQRSDQTQFLNSEAGWLFTTANYQNPDHGTQHIRTYLYHTSDGGVSWEPVGDLPGSGQFSFVDPQNGWAAMQDGELITLQRSTDGGKNWDVIPAVVSLTSALLPIATIPGPGAISHFQPDQAFEIETLTMIDSNLGWALTQTGPSDGHVLYTQDGGSNWKDVTPPEPASTITKTTKYPTAFFLDDRHAWVTYYPVDQAASGPALIWRTDDGGATWHTGQPLTPGTVEGSFTPSQFYFVDSEQGWLLMAHGAAAGSQPVTLYHTQDGGQTWPRILDILSPESADINTCCQTGMLFTNPSNGLITTNFGPDIRVHVSWSKDGGKSWQRQDLPLPAQLPIGAICGALSPVFTPPDSIYLLMECLNPDTPATEPVYYFYATSDFGGHWSSVPLPEPGRLNSEWRLDHRDHSIEFINPQIGRLSVTDFYESGNGKSQKLVTHLYQTSDAGQTWQSISKVNWGGEFSFIDANLGWAIARDYPQQYALVKTNDGGRSWAIIHPTILP